MMTKKIKATKPSIIVKARIKFAHALKKDTQHSHITPGFNNPQTRGELSQGVHEDSGWPYSKAENLNEHSTTAKWTTNWSGALRSCNNAMSSVSDKRK